MRGRYMRGRYVVAYVRAQHEGHAAACGGVVHVVVCRDERAAVCTWCMWWCVHVVHVVVCARVSVREIFIFV